MLVLGLPRGGVPVADAVARGLEAPLDVLVVRKLGVPGHEELAMGAVASNGVRVVNESVVASLGIADDVLTRVPAAEQAEVERREHLYRGDREPVDVRGRLAILVDDGLATGSTMRAAALATAAQAPQRVVVAAPVAARETAEALRKDVDEVVCVATPEPFYAVGLWYDDFSPTTDGEVRALVDAAPQPARADDA